MEGLEVVRKRLGMYIGFIDSWGLYYLVYEIVDNVVDEVLLGYGSEIDVIIYEDNSIIVVDSGCGMFVGMYVFGILIVEVIFIVLYVGGKFG